MNPFLRFPTRLHRSNSIVQDAMIRATTERTNRLANQANSREQRTAEFLTRSGIANREYMNFVTGLNDYLKL